MRYPTGRSDLSKDDLLPGPFWQEQIEAAISRSAAFLVYVGSRGIVNFVNAEVRLALERAITEPEYLFIPFLSTAAPGPETLPGFVRLYQCLRASEVQKLFDVLSGDGVHGGHRGVDEPFFGLSPIDESRSHLFFGREKETQELIERVFEQPLVLVSGDSGAGKSSLVRAGLVPHFRGGDMATLAHERPDNHIWLALYRGREGDRGPSWAMPSPRRRAH